MSERTQAAEVALAVAREAAQLVMRVYAAPFDVEYKIGDDPVTRADREANSLACERLGRAFPGVPSTPTPTLSSSSRPMEQRGRARPQSSNS